MCAHALNKVEIKRVVFGCGNDKFGGNGSILSIHLHPKEVKYESGFKGYSITNGVMAQEAIELLRFFYKDGNVNAPDNKR